MVNNIVEKIEDSLLREKNSLIEALLTAPEYSAVIKLGLEINSSGDSVVISNIAPVLSSKFMNDNLKSEQLDQFSYMYKSGLLDTSSFNESIDEVVHAISLEFLENPEDVIKLTLSSSCNQAEESVNIGISATRISESPDSSFSDNPEEDFIDFLDDLVKELKDSDPTDFSLGDLLKSDLSELSKSYSMGLSDEHIAILADSIGDQLRKFLIMFQLLED